MPPAASATLLSYHADTPSIAFDNDDYDYDNNEQQFEVVGGIEVEATRQLLSSFENNNNQHHFKTQAPPSHHHHRNYNNNNNKNNNSYVKPKDHAATIAVDYDPDVMGRHRTSSSSSSSSFARSMQQRTSSNASSSSSVTYLQFHRESGLTSTPAPPLAQQLHDDIERDERYRAPAPAGLDEIMDHLLDMPCCDGNNGNGSPNQVYTYTHQPDHYMTDEDEIRHDDREALTHQIDEQHREQMKLPSALRNSSKSKTTSNRHVSFQDVIICQFPMTLGHHPSATSGPPVMLDYNGIRQDFVVPLDIFEQTRRTQRRKTRRQLRLSLKQRHTILCNHRGFTFEQVRDAWQDALTVRKQRQETLERNPALLKWDEAWESMCRKVGRAVMMGGAH